MTGAGLLGDLTIALAAGFVGALVARQLRLPPIVGYLVAGAVVGPAGFKLVRNSEAVSAMGELGVALLLFVLGVELSLRSLVSMRSAALVAAPVQIAVSVALGYGLGRLLGWSLQSGLILGFVVALSSTTVGVRLLGDRGEANTNHGRLMITILLVQDLAAVFMVGMLPLLAGGAATGLGGGGALVARGLAFLLAVVLLAHWVVPALLRFVARSYRREVFVALAALMCFGGAFAGYELGFSLALGAFVAGLMLSESDYAHELLADITPLRDLLGLIFFVSLGLLFEPRVVMAHPTWIVAILAAVIVGKGLIVLGSSLLARFHLRSASIAAFGLAHIGEVSFVIAALAADARLISLSQRSLIDAAAGISLLLSPALLSAGGAAYMRLRAADRAGAAEDDVGGQCAVEAAPVIICGYGRVGSHVGEMLLQEGQTLAVIDYDQRVVTHLRQRGVTALYGDAARRRVLIAAGAANGCLAILALPDAVTTRLAARALRRINPSLRIIARVHVADDIDVLYREGAEEVVHAEFEASLEIMRHTLLRLGRGPEAVQERIDGIRQEQYRSLRDEEMGRSVGAG